MKMVRVSLWRRPSCPTGHSPWNTSGQPSRLTSPVISPTHERNGLACRRRPLFLAYLAAGAYWRGSAQALLWLRITALLVPPLTGVLVIAVRRRDWTGCQWLFWATIALGLSMTAISIVGWTVDEVLLGRETSWLGWYTVFALFGAVAPLFALLAQPHRGAREPITASTAVDIAGIAVITGFLYSHFVVGSDWRR